MSESPPSGPDNETLGSDLAAKLNKLFATMRRPSEQPLSNAAAADAITGKTGIPISGAYIWQLRNGMKTNPTAHHLRAIAEFFGVAPSYLIDPGIDPRIDDQLTLLQAMRDAGVRDLAMRASGLTPRSINNIARMIDHARELEHLPPVDTSSDDSDAPPGDS